jgi:hypothetical protein
VPTAAGLPDLTGGDCARRSYGGPNSELAEWALPAALELLEPSSFVYALTAVMLERPTAILHASANARSSIALAITAVLAPFAYHHPLLPILPHTLYGVVCSPTPYLIGLPGMECVAEFTEGGGASAVCFLDVASGELQEGEIYEGEPSVAVLSHSWGAMLGEH